MRRIILISSLGLVSLLGTAIIRVKTNEPPDREITIARKMISEADLIKSTEFAKEQYSVAVNYYDSALSVWRLENERFILFRNYRRIDELARKSSESSRSAIAGARKNILKIEDLLEFRMNELGGRIKDFDRQYGNFLTNYGHRNEIVRSKIQYSEGVLAFENKNYTLCKSKFDSVETTIKRVSVLYEEKLNSFFNEYPKWSEMVEQTKAFSKRNEAYCIVVDKLARECMLYKNGKVLHSYTVELGANWMGDKNQRGDKSTPEGFYKITDKKSNGQTRFYKALLLDYPNDDDKKRFLQNKKSGVIHPDATIGNLIEIHGQGGKGVDWTDGCIALADGDMDVIFKLCPVGTRVTIVGTAKSLNELVDK